MKLSRNFLGKIKIAPNRIPFPILNSSYVLGHNFSIPSLISEGILSHSLDVINYVLPSSYRYNFDAADSGSITESAGKVTGWTSTGTNTSTFTESNNNYRPTYNSVDKYVNFDNGGSFYGRLGVDMAALPNLSTPNWHIFAVVDAATVVGTDIGAYSNDPVFSFAQYGGLYLRKNGANYSIQGHVYDGTGHKASETTGFLLNTRTVIEAKATGTVVASAINGGSFNTTAAGNSTNSAGWPTGIGWGWASSQYLRAKIHQIIVYSDDLNDTDRAQAVGYLATKWNVTI